ncbi:MAG TPA: adenylate/guanylate cyclase domain-containing protein [Vicinamibacterales bacterium]|nr:adenylate/guanylate cyclase domain-containing protein [Vicinamibacterales bacterium]
MLTVTFSEGGSPRTEWLAQGETLIGRAQSNQIVMTHPTVSRQHARLRVSGDRCFLSDAGSRFGIRVNDAPLEGERELVAGDVFTLGQVIVTLEQKVSATELLSERHQLLEESGTIIRKVVETGAGGVRPVEPAGVAIAEGRPEVNAPAAAVIPVPTAWPSIERRRGEDRRRVDSGRAAGERRSGRERRGSRFLRLLTEISNTLVTMQPLPQVLARVVDLVFGVVPADRVFLLLRDSSDQALTARVMRNRDRSTPDRPTLSRTVVNRVLRERVAMLAADARYDPRLDAAGSIQAMNIRSFMCAPLWNRDEVIGVLYCDNPRTKKFTSEDLDVFTALCNYAAVAIEQARLSSQLVEELRRREKLQRYHSPAVVNRILQGGTGSDAGLMAQEREVTVMFCDLVGFTQICEPLAPYEIAQLLNGFFSRMAEVIFEYEGTLDKFIGDALLAVFGAPFDQPDHAVRAVETALAMQRALAAMNTERPDRHLRMRIAINSGRAMTGDMGSPRRREFTVLGDVVNTASRIEDSVAEPDQIVVTGATASMLKERFTLRTMGPVTLRGRQAPIEVFEVVG